MKKWLWNCFVFVFVLMWIVIPATVQAEAMLRIVCSTFPSYDFCRNILGECAESATLTLLMESGADLHNYQPDVQDMLAVSKADVLVTVGGESDAWLDSMLATVKNDDLRVLRLMDCVESKADEQVEGMEAHDHEHDEACEDEHHDHAHDEHDSALDEHVWLSLRNAVSICRNIADVLSELDAVHATAYDANCQAYTAKLEALDAQYTAMVATAKRDTILVADRFPFRYLTDDYGLTYYAAFSGCSAESEASFETVAFLMSKARELALTTLLITESGDGKLAKTIGTACSPAPQVLALDSMQSVNRGAIDGGVTYLSIMESNLMILRAALDAE